MRLFVSVDLPASLSDEVATVQDRLRDASGLNFADPTQAHLTLKFLGDTAPAKLDGLQDALEAAVASVDVSPFEATVGGLGAFPSRDYIRVVWLGFESGGDRLRRLHESIEARTVELGFDPEEHDFTPHVTIARMEHAGGKELVQRILREDTPTVGTLSVDEIRLTESYLGPDGPEYSTVASVPL